MWLEMCHRDANKTYPRQNRKRNPEKVLKQPLCKNRDCVAEDVWNSFYPLNTGGATLQLCSSNPCKFGKAKFVHCHTRHHNELYVCWLRSTEYRQSTRVKSSSEIMLPHSL
ncbi:hypothetical protein AVEN_156572-1, partial [Araneus ventricosus]